MFRAPSTALTLLLLFAATADAVMPPEVYRQARRDAAHHVQVEITKATVPDRTPGECRLEGTVVKVFRSRGDVLAAGTPVAFTLSCLRPGDEPMLGGTLWGSADSLRAARFVEAYFDGADAGALHVARWQYMLIDAPTDTPRCTADSPGLTCW